MKVLLCRSLGTVKRSLFSSMEYVRIGYSFACFDYCQEVCLSSSFSFMFCPYPRPLLAGDVTIKRDLPCGLTSDVKTERDVLCGLTTDVRTERDLLCGLTCDVKTERDPRRGLTSDVKTERDPPCGLTSDVVTSL